MAQAAGITWELARTWPGSRERDSKLSDAEIKKTAESLLKVSQHIANGVRNGGGTGK